MQIRKKHLLQLGIAAAAGMTAMMQLAVQTSAQAENTGWFTNGNKRYYAYEDGTLAVGEVTLDNIPYLFAPNGAQQTGWQTVGGKRYFYDSSGEAQFGWIRWRGEDYFVSQELGKLTEEPAPEQTASFDKYGVLQRQAEWIRDKDGTWHYTKAAGEVTIDGTAYLFDGNGSLQTGWQTLSDGIERYYDPETHTLRTGWIETDGQRYYADEAAGKLTGAQTVDGLQLLFSDSGALVTGFDTDASGVTRCYDAETGEMYRGFRNISGNTYYFAENGAMQTGFLHLNDDLYYLGDNGIMQTGWITQDANVYYADENGILTAGWKRINGIIYYFNGKCIRESGPVLIDGVTFLLNKEGIPQTGWYTAPNGDRYYGAFNAAALTGWQDIGGKRYYFDKNGVMATGTRDIDGRRRCFRADGSYCIARICLDAGHYGKYNHSPVNSAYWESDFTWKMHLYLKEELEKYNIEVITTRPDQATDLALEERGKTSEGCNLFLSIHSNAGAPANDGPLACCAINGSADDLGLKLANKIADVMNTNQRGSIWKREGLRGDWYGVLRGATSVGTPAILLEHSYHTNLRATNWLLVDANVRKMAVAEAKLLADYYSAN